MYYANSVTGETTWDAPPGFRSSAAAPAAAAASVWSALVDDDGDVRVCAAAYACTSDRRVRRYTTRILYRARRAGWPRRVSWRRKPLLLHPLLGQLALARRAVVSRKAGASVARTRKAMCVHQRARLCGGGECARSLGMFVLSNGVI